MLYRFRYVIVLVLVLLLIASVLLAVFAGYTSFVATSGNGVPSLFGSCIFSIRTDSMYPALKPGDLIFATAVDAEELSKGDIITYWTVISGERVLNTHRIEAVYDAGSYRVFATKGDNNIAEDALSVHESEIVGRYAFRIGGLGKVFDYLQTSTGFTVLIMATVFLAVMLLAFIVVWKRRFM